MPNVCFVIVHVGSGQTDEVRQCLLCIPSDDFRVILHGAEVRASERGCERHVWFFYAFDLLVERWNLTRVMAQSSDRVGNSETVICGQLRHM